MHPFYQWFRSVKVQNAMVLSMGAALFFYRISHEPLWLDESYSATMSSHSIWEIWHYAKTDVHPPLYYMLLHGVTALAGTTALAYRLLSAVCAIGIVALGVGPISELYGRRVGLFFSLLVISAPSTISFAQEARMYTMMAFAVTGFTVYGMLALKSQKLRDYMLFSVFFAAAMYTHYFALLAAAILGGYVLGYQIIQTRFRDRKSWIAIGIPILLYLPWIPSLWSQVTRVASGFWIPKTSAFILEYAAMMPFSYKFEDIPYPPWALGSMGISLGLISFGLYRAVMSRPRQFHLFAPVLLFVCTFAAGILLSISIEPILMPRYILFGTPLFFLAVALGLNAVSRDFIRYSALTALLLLMIPTDVNIYRHNFNGPFKEVAQIIHSVPDDGAPIVHEDWQTLMPLRQQLPERIHLFLSNDSTAFDGFYGENRPIGVQSIDEVFEYGTAAWFVDSNLMPLLTEESIRNARIVFKIPPRKMAPPFSFVHPVVLYGRQTVSKNVAR